MNRNLLYEILRREVEREKALHTYRDNELYVTEISSCLRKAWYERKYGTPFDPKMVVVANMGRAFHEWLENIIRNHVDGIAEMEIEYKVNDGLVVR